MHSASAWCRGSVSANGVVNAEGCSTLREKIRSKYHASEALKFLK